MNIKYDFKNKNAVITGGAQGIGFQIAKDFLTAGARVSIWDVSEEALQKARTELSQFPTSHVHTVATDVARFESCQKAAESVPFPVHILVNNAGITRDKSFAKMTSNEFDQVVDINLKGLFNVTKNLVEKFDPQSTEKRIVNLSSVVALYGNFGQANYVSSKAGVIGFTKTLARELGRKGFTVNAIAPGFTRTRMTEAMPREVLDQMAQKVPLNRLGTTDDISNACLFLSSANAGYINGHVLSVDGGMVV